MGRTWGRAGAAALGIAAVVMLASSCVLDGSWATVATPAVDSPSHRLSAVHCPTSEVCVATGSKAAPWGGGATLPFVAVRDVDGWSRHDIVAPYKTYLDITCSTPDQCLMPWEQWYPDDAVPYTGIDAWDGSSVTQVIVEQTAAAACVPGGPCRVIEPSANSTWDGDALVPWGTGSSTAVDVVSCPSVDFCLGVGSGSGQVVRFDAAGGHPVASPAGVDGPLNWPELDCLSATNCQILGTLTLPGGGSEQVYLSWDGTALVERDGPDVEHPATWSVSCSSTSACIAISGGSTIAYNGATWYDAPASPDGTRLAAASCPAGATSCLAVGTSGVPGADTSAAAEYSWTDS